MEIVQHQQRSYIGEAEFCRIMKISPRTAYRWRQAGLIKGLKHNGVWLIRLNLPFEALAPMAPRRRARLLRILQAPSSAAKSILKGGFRCKKYC